ncbi:MAG: glycosyltransferase family 9 protein [Rubrivivax sp.]|nr:glycosyltransferase family 9 protein [Rubrivivax sp.]
MLTAESPGPPSRGRDGGPLVVRLRNWVGDVLLGLPMLQRLADAGHELHLVGKGWARDLLAGHGWPVEVLPKTLRERVALLRRLREAGTAKVPAASAPARRQRIDALCLPYSLSSALEFRLAGARALGHAHEGRSWLLARALPLQRGRHELQTYWELGDALLGQAAPLPERLALKLAPAHREAAAKLRAEHGIGGDAHRAGGAIVICPFAGGTFDKADKTWPGFAAFVHDDLVPLAERQGRQVLVCPGPGEEAIARSDFPRALCLEGVGLGTYAALLAEAALMISNDTGPGHLAAAVDTPLLSVLGPTDPAQWRAWGPQVHLLGGNGRWPQRGEVLAAVHERLAETAAAARPPR